MATTTLIMGATHESVNTAIWLASLHKPVKILADKAKIAQTLVNYQFDHQMSALWQMYTQTAQIVVVDVICDASYVWVFLDDMDVQYSPLYQTTAQVILSGVMCIGEIAQLASQFTTKQVCYVPFVFMKDSVGFASISAPDMVMIGEKHTDVHHDNALLSILLAHSQKRYVTDIKTIEFARASIMAMLATRLSFINEMARLADASGVDMTVVQQILGLDSRIGKDYLVAGWGFGGQTLPTEVALLDALYHKMNVTSQLLTTVSRINEDQKELIFRKFWRYFDGFIDDKSVMIWGAGYRPNTGRTTNSAIHPLLRLLWSYNIKTTIYTPNAGFELNELYGSQPLFSLADDAYALAEVDALFILNWLPYVTPDVDKLNQFGMPIFDAKNILTNEAIACLTGDYQGIGRNFIKNGN